MPNQTIRFLHASGLQLHDVVGGLPEAPEHLLELLVHAPYRATEQFFQTAVREEVDLVLLSGDLLDAAGAGPRGVAFLLKQFDLLRDNGVPIYWAASKLDLATDWLKHVELPDNVHVFARDLVEARTLSIHDQPAVTILGRSWNPQRPWRASEFVAPHAEGLHVAVLGGSCDWEGINGGSLAYWGMGGSSQASTSSIGQQVVHCPGWLQGLTPSQAGAHGCTLVHIDAAGDVRTRRLEVDVVRWLEERVTVSEGASLADVRTLLRNRLQKLMQEAGRPLLIRWILRGDAWFDHLLMDEGNRRDMLQWLRDEFGQGSQPAWSVVLQIEPPARFRDEWTDEDSILGDYLRTVREFLDAEEQGTVERPVRLDVEAARRQLPAELSETMSLEEPSRRLAVLREAALLGVDLLRGDERPADVKQRALEAESLS